MLGHNTDIMETGNPFYLISDLFSDFFDLNVFFFLIYFQLNKKNVVKVVLFLD